jgi:uncharacterized membrane protein
MKQPIVHTNQQEVDSTVAFLIAVGILLALGGLVALFDFFVSRERNLLQLAAPFGSALTACGFALKRRNRHAWAASMIICCVGLAWFPIGTVICGRLLAMLLKVRSSYHPSLKMPQAQQASTSNGG